MSKQPNRGKRNRSVQFWSDEHEFQFIAEKAEEACLSKGRYCRKVILGEIPQASRVSKAGITASDIEEIKKELVKAGTNLNQIAKKFNTTDQPPAPGVLDDLYSDYSKVYSKILRVLS